MTHEQMLNFILKMTKHGLDHVQHFDDGGTVLSGPAVAGTQNAVNPASQGIAGAVGNILGTNNNFQATGANINPGTNVGQLNQAYTGTQGALNQANNLTNQLNPGIAQGAGSQNMLTNQLAQESVGGGPNPAQAALNQNTSANVANQAALMAGQRGAGANAGLIARQAAQQGGALQQQAVGQEATQASQQQLAAQNALQNLSAQQVQQGTNAVQLGNQAQQNEQNILQGANTAGNNASVSMQSNINSTNAAVASGNQDANQDLLPNIGSALGSIGKGIVDLFAGGGEVPEHMHTMAKIYHPHLYGGGEVKNMGTRLEAGGKVPGKPMVNKDDYDNDTVDAKLSPGEVVIDLNTLKDKGKLGQMARFVAQNIERKNAGRKLV